MLKDLLNESDKKKIRDFIESPEFKEGIIKEFLLGEEGVSVKLNIFFGKDSVFYLSNEKGFLVPVDGLKNVFLVMV